MNERWTDERLDRFADKVDRIADKIDQQGEQIGRLIEALYLELPNIKAEINSVREEAREQRETLHAELVEIKEITRQQALNAERLTIAAQIQADAAKTQAENIRLMIEMVNRKQA
jgi:ABC-type transporter Mla subunit MlaD